MEKPVLTIITVCFQSAEQVRATMECVLQQTWKQFEYVVIDGGSDDGTRELLEASGVRFEEKGIPFRFVSEPDQGIYDAMNKGTKTAQGRWLLFLNAGDLLAGEQVLEQVFAEIPPKAQIMYGDTLCTYQGQTRLYPALSLENLPYEMAFCHQSVFVLRKLLLLHPYDTAYRICADHEFFLAMYLEGKEFAYRPLTISIYEIAGYSDQNQMTAHKEQRRMRRELGISRFTIAGMRREMIFYMKQGMKAVCGQWLIDLVRRKRS